jgi:hypothetical protein
MEAAGIEVCSPLCAVPPIALFRLVAHGGHLHFDAAEHYVKQSIRNRYHILTANGVEALSIPVKRTGGLHVSTANVAIEHRKPWLRTHLRTLQAAYGSAPFYIHYIDAVTALLSKPVETLGELFSETFDKWCTLLGFAPPYTVHSHFLEGTFHFDLRLKIKYPEDFPASILPPIYPQVFEDRHPFAANLSVIDLLFNEGPAALSVLRS